MKVCSVLALLSPVLLVIYLFVLYKVYQMFMAQKEKRRTTLEHDPDFEPDEVLEEEVKDSKSKPEKKKKGVASKKND